MDGWIARKSIELEGTGKLSARMAVQKIPEASTVTCNETDYSSGNNSGLQILVL